MNVVLPAPFGPISACRAPGCELSDTSPFGDEAAERFGEPLGAQSAAIAMPVARCAAVRWIASSPPRRPPGANSTITTSSSADPELPVRRVMPDSAVLRDHEHRRADQPAVQAAGAAEHQHDQQLRRALEAERVDADELRRLREQRARHAGHRRRDREDRPQAPVHRQRRSPACAARSADAAQREAERRMHQPPHEQEQQRQRPRGCR